MSSIETPQSIFEADRQVPPHAHNATNTVAMIGLALGGVFGMAGTIVASPILRAGCWALDGVGLIVATALLAAKYFREGKDVVSAGFLVFAIGEAVMLSGTAATLEASVPSFAAGTALWSASLFLTCIPRQFAIGVRVPALIGSALFAITSARIFLGEQVLPISSPLPFFAYPFLVFTLAGWIWTLRKQDGAR